MKNKESAQNKIIFSGEFDQCKNRSNKDRKRNNKVFSKFICKIKNFFTNAQLIKKVGIFFISGILFSLGINYLLTAKYFNVNKVEFVTIENKKLKYLDLTEFQNYKQKLISQNYFKVNTFELEEKLKGNPLVDYVYVEKRYPDKIRFVIKEREPIFTVNVNEHSCVTLDNKGFVLDKIIKSEEVSCLDQIVYREVSLIKLVNTHLEFEKNKQANSYLVKNLDKVKNLLEKNKYSIKQITVHGESCQIDTIKYENEDSRETVFVIDLGEDIDNQTAKLEIIYSQYLGGENQYNIVDLRYNRPVLKQ